MLITLEGIDGSGKSTQLKLISSFLRERGRNVVTTREPGWNQEVSGILRHLILHGNTSPAGKLFLLLADRAEHFDKMVGPLNKGGYGVPTNTVILSDRGGDSTIAYQGFGDELLSVRTLVENNKVAMQGVVPTITFLLDMPIDQALKRAKDPNYFEQRGPEYFERVRGGFLEISKVDKDRVVVLDATQSINEIQEQIRKILTNRFGL